MTGYLADKARTARTTISSFRTPLMWYRMLGIVVILLLPFYMTIFSFGGHLVSRIMQPENVYLLPMFASAWLADVVGFLIVSAIVRQLLFDQRRALWIENDKLIFIHRRYFSVPCREIASLTTGVMGRTRNEAIVVNQRNGKQMKFPTSSLTEPRDIVVDRLNSVLRLPSRR